MGAPTTRCVETSIFCVRYVSTRLGQSLLDAGLIDELRLVVAPVVLGAE